MFSTSKTIQPWDMSNLTYCKEHNIFVVAIVTRFFYAATEKGNSV